MKPFAESPWKQRGAFFLAGVVVAFLCFYVEFRWMDIVPYGAFDQQPEWLKALDRLVGWLPWFAVAVVLFLRLWKGSRFRVGLYALGTVTPMTVLIGWILFGDRVDEWMHRRAFDETGWRDPHAAEQDVMWPTRLCMIDDLMASDRLLGMTRDGVVALLGPPEPAGFPAGAAAIDMHYYLGPERGFVRIDSEWLFLNFDEDGRVSRQWLDRD